MAATEAEDHDGVRVMTIHTAKGLEFPVVAVPGLGRTLNAGGRPPDLILGRGADEGRVGLRLVRFGARSIDLYERDSLAERAQALECAEDLRLFYVAATRARERLLLSGLTPTARSGEMPLNAPVTERLVAAWEIENLERDGAVTLPPAPTSPGLDADLPSRIEVAVRLNRPSPEQAAHLAEAALGGRPAVEVGTGVPPIVEPRSPVTPRRPLSYSALDSYRRCGYRFYNESVLGLSAVTNGGRAATAGRDFGNAIHELLERSSRNRWVEPSEAFAKRALAAHGLGDPESLERARGLVRGWIDSPLRASLSESEARLQSEVPFLVELEGSVVRGQLDLLARPRDEPPTVVDYKTDRLGGDPPTAHADRYSMQRDLYALAAAQATGAERVRVAYVFLEHPEEPVIEELDTGAIDAARARLEATIAELSAGRFEVTSTPDWDLCRDCPARRRLCSAPASPPGE